MLTQIEAAVGPTDADIIREVVDRIRQLSAENPSQSAPHKNLMKRVRRWWASPDAKLPTSIEDALPIMVPPAGDQLRLCQDALDCGMTYRASYKVPEHKTSDAKEARENLLLADSSEEGEPERAPPKRAKVDHPSGRQFATGGAVTGTHPAPLQDTCTVCGTRHGGNPSACWLRTHPDANHDPRIPFRNSEKGTQYGKLGRWTIDRSKQLNDDGSDLISTTWTMSHPKGNPHNTSKAGQGPKKAGNKCEYTSTSTTLSHLTTDQCDIASVVKCKMHINSDSSDNPILVKCLLDTGNLGSDYCSPKIGAIISAVGGAMSPVDTCVVYQTPALYAKTKRTV
jgi:hypothetical protein